MAKAHINISKDDCLTKCEKCKETFNQVDKFNKHLVECSSEVKNFKCKQCDTENWHSDLALQKHLLLDHEIKGNSHLIYINLIFDSNIFSNICLIFDKRKY